VFCCGETAHDRFFHRAGEMLGLPRQFAKAGIHLHNLMQADTRNGIKDDGRTKLIEKVRKVLALARSGNEHEARLALEMSARLMRRHELEHSEIEIDLDDITYAIIPLGKRRIRHYQRLIASLLSRYFGVRLICSQLYDAAADRTCRTFEIFGSRENVAVAEHCYYFLEVSLGGLWREHRPSGVQSRARDKGSYYCGVLHGFEQTLKTDGREEFSLQDVPPDSCQRANASLPVPVERMIDACIRRRHPRLRTVGGRKTLVNRELFTSGVLAGRELRLRRAVGKANGNDENQKLLEANSTD
jgi:hypothetical protein